MTRSGIVVLAGLALGVVVAAPWHTTARPPPVLLGKPGRAADSPQGAAAWPAPAPGDVTSPTAQARAAAVAAGTQAEPTVDAAAADAADYRAARARVSALIEATYARLAAASPDTDSALVALRELHDAVLDARPDAAADALDEFIASGRDSTTGLPFVVGEDGMMEAVPSLRTALLDLLPATDLPLATDIARTVLDQRRSPEEYALALRNLAWSDYDGDLRDELGRRVNDLLNLSLWREQASAGYLEALDAAVELGDAATFRAVSQLVAADADGRPGPAADLNRAAFIALDRMAVRDPNVVVAALHDEPRLLATAPSYRASLMSRLDLTVPSQRESLLRYLARGDLGADERRYFAEIFPNANYLHGNWLITAADPGTTDLPQRARDRAVVDEIDRILGGTPAASATAQVLERVRVRLVAFERAAALDALDALDALGASDAGTPSAPPSAADAVLPAPGNDGSD